jgi:phosphopantothenoylcysteine decarboxylase / phosphopantothenate---cysteine ligase
MNNKNLDLVVLNSMNDKNATFGHDTNKVSIIERNREIHLFPLKDKKEVAVDIVNMVDKFFAETEIIK